MNGVLIVHMVDLLIILTREVDIKGHLSETGVSYVFHNLSSDLSLVLLVG